MVDYMIIKNKIPMSKRISFLVFSFSILSVFNPSAIFAASEDEWYNYGYYVGAISSTCTYASEGKLSTRDARNYLKQIYKNANNNLNETREVLFEWAAEEKMCLKYLP